VVAPEHAEPFVTGAAAAFDTKRTAYPGDTGGLSLVAAIVSTEGLTLNGGADELGRRLGKAMKQAKAVGKTNHVVWSKS
jgi:hypothetical protein